MKKRAKITDDFQVMLNDHKKLIFKIANAYTRTEEDRDDLMQEIIAQFWRSFPNYDRKYAFSTWIYRIALNVSISFFRKEKKRKQLISGHQGLIEVIPQNNPSREWEDKLQQLHNFIAELNPLDKALMLLYLDKKSQEEISKIIGISTSNVSTKIGRIKKQLKRRFELLNK